MPTNTHQIKWILLIPIIGSVLFILLYILAATRYPGGNAFHPSSPGFSWQHNYWCNLLDANAINGQMNTGRPFAVTGMIVLCLSLSHFWWTYPKFSSLKNIPRKIIQISGLLSMSTGILLMTNIDHDLVTNLASFSGIIAVTGTLAGLYKKQWHGLFYFGILNLVFVIANNILYYNHDLRSYLPVTQKLSFSVFLIWICLIVKKYFHQASVPGKMNVPVQDLKDSGD